MPVSSPICPGSRIAAYAQSVQTVFVIAAPIGLIAFLASWVPFFPLGSAFFPENPVLHAPAVQETASRYALPRLRWRCPGCSPKRPRCCSSPEHRRCHHLEENPAAAELVLDEVALVTLDQAACS
jgi:hypothetical protein